MLAGSSYSPHTGRRLDMFKKLGDFLYQSVFPEKEADPPPPRASAAPRPHRPGQSDEIVALSGWSTPLRLDPDLELAIEMLHDPVDPEVEAELVRLENLLKNAYV